MCDEKRWYADGRVPGGPGRPWKTVTVGPFPTALEAGKAAQVKHLGGIHVYTDEVWPQASKEA